MKLKLFIMEDMFCIKREDTLDNHYFFPCGELKQKRLFIEALIKQGPLSFQYIREEDKRFLEENFPGKFGFHSVREDWEYIYDKREQIELCGRKFKHLRSKIHKGKKSYDWTVQTLTTKDMKSAAKVAAEWKYNGKKEEEADRLAALTAFHSFEELKLSGILLLEKGLPMAVALGTKITKDTFDLHLSKAVVRGIDHYLKWELYKRLPTEVAYINREEDLGIEGLRMNKLEMKPIRFHKLWKGWTKGV